MVTAYKNARVLDARGEYRGEVYVRNGRILHAGTDGAGIPADEEIDVLGMLLMPAFIDCHCHLRDPGFPKKETMETGMRAALKGGFATLCAMANTDPVCETPELVERNHKRAEELRLTNLIQAAAAGIGLGDGTPTDYEALSKVTRVITNDGKTIFSDAFMENLLRASTKYGFVISTHCQPERAIVARDLALLKKAGGNLHVGHISRSETARMIREAKAAGLKLTCEVTPHHLIGCDSDYKVNPPLRTYADTRALIDAVADGTVGCFATDHAPHTQEDKQNGMAGISNIEYAMQVYLKVCSENAIPLTRFSELLSANPAKILGLDAGLIEPGMRADIVIVDPDMKDVIRRNTMISRSNNTPFDGVEVQGRVLKTIVGGELRYEYGQARTGR
ncbi:MAG: dihydroorotase [Bacillota bacterium]